MAFLSPLFLVGLLAGLIPIAIHFIRREKPVKVNFSTLRFFKNTSRKHFLFQRIQQWLLLLLRTAAVALLAVSFARPFFSQNLSALVNLAPKSEVILVDSSMSMAYPGVFEQAKRAAKDRIDELNPGDEAAVVFFSGSKQQAREFTTDFDALKQFVDSINEPNWERTRFFPALRSADEMLEHSNYDEKSVALISDFQAEGMLDFEPQWKLKPGVDFFTVDVGMAETRNLAVTGIKLPAQIRGESSVQDLHVRVRSFGSLLKDEVNLILNVDGSEQSRQKLNLAGQSERIVTVPLALGSEGESPEKVSHFGKLTIEGDEFTADDDFYFTVDVLPKIRVLVINGESSSDWINDEGHWFELAARSNNLSPFAVESVAVERWNPGNNIEQDVVVLLNVGTFQSAQIDSLIRYVRAGGHVLIAPGDRVDGNEFNRLLGDISPATMIAQSQPRRDDYLVIADMAMRHPILMPLDLDWNVRFEGYWQVQAHDSAEVIMSFDNGMPALLERQVEAGHVLLFASPLDTEWNNLPLQGVYLPFVHQMLKYLAQSQQKQSFYTVGEYVALADQAGDLTDPEGRAFSLAEGANSFALSQPGLYRVQSAANISYYAANVPNEESDLSRVNSGDLLDRILNPETKPTQSREVRQQLLSKEIEKPQRLWWWVLLLVALVLLSESFVSNRTHR